jgi:hypothetical protein
MGANKPIEDIESCRVQADQSKAIHRARVNERRRLRSIKYTMCDANEGPKERFFDATEVDEGRPLDVGRQRLASNQAVRLGFKRPWS